MHNLDKCFYECMKDLHAIDIYPNIDGKDVKATRQYKTWGLCKTRRNNTTGELQHRITIAQRLLDDTTPYKALRTTMLHELLHACDECYKEKHGGKWLEYANLVNDCYDVDIKQATSREENGCTFDDRKMYVIRCKGCGKELAYKYARMPKFYSRPQNYHCTKCGGGIERVGIFTQAEYKKRIGKELTAV